MGEPVGQEADGQGGEALHVLRQAHHDVDQDPPGEPAAPRAGGGGEGEGESDGEVDDEQEP